MTKHIICYSGGHSSALVAIEVVRKYGKDNVILLNHNINSNVEDQDIKRFKQEVADYLQIPITFANHKDILEEDVIPDQFDVVQKIGYFTDLKRNVLCTYELKTKPFHDYLEQHHPEKDVVIYYGFDKNEQHRIERRSQILGLKGYKSEFPLANWDRTILSTKEINIDPPLTYGQFKHANCIGCLKAGKQHWYVVYCTRKDVWEKAKKTEEEIGYSIVKGTYLKDLEAKFQQMEQAGIEPTEKTAPGKFWAEVRKKLKELNLAVTEEDKKPCECVF